MKTIQRSSVFYAIILLVVGTFVVGCSGSDDDIDQLVAKPELPVTHFSAEIAGHGGEDDANGAKAMRRVIINESADGKTLAINWKVGDEIAMIYKSKDAMTRKVTAKVISVSSGGSARISADLIGEITDGADVKMVYPAAAADESQTSGIDTDYLKEGQDGTLTTIANKFNIAVADANLSVDGIEGTDATLQNGAHFHNQIAICKFMFKNNGNTISGVCKFVLSGDADDALYSNVKCDKLESVYLAVDPTNTDKKKFTVYSMSDKVLKEYSASFTPSLQAGKYYRSTLPFPDGKDVAVDLDLPSGILWALFNVGATKPEEFGDYFAYGATEPYYTEGNAQNTAEDGIWKEGKSAGYTWSTDKFYDIPSKTYTKYIPADGKKVLEPEDDAATVNWGSSWRMPTIEDFDELFFQQYPFSKTSTSKCCGYTDNYKGTGVGGVAVYDTSGNILLFFPKAGARDDKRVRFDFADYWSSTLSESSFWYGWYLNFYPNTEVEKRTYGRPYGRSVRPVFVL